MLNGPDPPLLKDLFPNSGTPLALPTPDRSSVPIFPTLSGAVMNKTNNIKPKKLLLMNADPEEAAGVSLLLKEAGYTALIVATPGDLKLKLKEASFTAVIMDLDSIAMDNQTIRRLSAEFPATPFLCVSKERFHPELKESILSHIYACLTKPVDAEELRYWLKCIQEDDRNQTLG